MITKRDILKNILIGCIVVGVGSVIYYVLPEFLDLESEKVSYTGFPTYSCTEPFEVTSCLNRTALQGYIFTPNGKSVMDTGFKFASSSP